MLVVFKGIKNENIVVFDAEYNEGDLIQFSGILFRRIEKEIYQISKSLNIYVKLENGEYINYFIRDFTGITDIFLEENGITLDDAKEKIQEFLCCKGDILFVSHGLYNDRQTLLNNGIDFYNVNGNETFGFCTYNHSKIYLERNTKLRLADVAADAGIFLANKHNAFDDTWATVAIFSLLCKLKEGKENERKVL